MATVTLPRSVVAQRDLAPKGTWWSTPNLAGGFAVHVKCPLCSTVGRLYTVDGRGVPEGHDIDKLGQVMPALTCCNPRGCAWKVFARLEGWNPEARR